MVWDWDFAWETLPKLLSVLHITISATLVGFLFAVVWGLVLAFARRSRLKIVSWTALAFIEFVRTTPLLVQLFFIFYVLPRYGLVLSPFVAGVLGLGLHYSTYLAEVYRAGIDSVEKGQWEAATALNLSTRQKWTSVILPQAVRPVLPVMGNYLIVMFKETPLLSAITLVEIVTMAQKIGSDTFRYLEPLTLVGILFLILSYTASILVRRLELRLEVSNVNQS